MGILLGFLLVLASLFLIMIVLVQRGRGGGLTGALGGAGGQSAFGAKAGDVFTRITIGAAAVWIILCVVTVKWVGDQRDPLDLGGANTPPAGEMDSTFTSEKTSGTGGADKSATGSGTEKAGTEKSGTESSGTESSGTEKPATGESTPPATESSTEKKAAE